MTATTRQIISVLLSLLLVISGPVLAISKVTDSQAEAAMSDCGSMVMDQAESASSSSGTESNCVSAPGMTCPSASGPGKCGGSFALLLVASNGLIDTGSQPVFSAFAGNYQEPFLASITPPPEHHC